MQMEWYAREIEKAPGKIIQKSYPVTAKESKLISSIKAWGRYRIKRKQG